MSKESDWRKCLICGDAHEYLAKIPDKSVNLILTDPPYNIGQYSTGNIPLPGRSPMNNDIASWDLIDFNPEDWADELVRILKPTGNLFIFTSYNQIGRWHQCLDKRFDTTNFMIWHKTNPAPKIFKAGFLNSCEMIFTCWNKGHTWNFISQAEMHNFIESPICMRPERLSNPKHPAQKPLTVLKKIINIASNPGDIILDPFMGVGSTGAAAIQLGRKFIGMDIDPAYFNAARQRIAEELASQTQGFEAQEAMATYYVKADPVRQFVLDFDFDLANERSKDITVSAIPQVSAPRLEALLKWAGGKERELKYILPSLPPDIDRYFEPFVGGGSVFAVIEGAKRYFINDISSELISLYRSIGHKDAAFFSWAEAIDASWMKAREFLIDNMSLLEFYKRYRGGGVGNEEFGSQMSDICGQTQSQLLEILPEGLRQYQTWLFEEFARGLRQKIKRMAKLEAQKHELCDDDLFDNFETIVKGALYMFYRRLYNKAEIKNENPQLATALFLFIRNYAYSGMFRYNSRGEFNVPYGGIGYNSKSLSKKLEYYRSASLGTRMANTEIACQDFETFLKQHSPCQTDFIFLDPPYDSEFSTYARNEFTHSDHERLAHYLIHDCSAKWMLVIKSTDFILSLYQAAGLRIQSFDKEYTVSFMNRNDRKATHLLITNY